jgi:hypothetical protein
MFVQAVLHKKDLLDMFRLAISAYNEFLVFTDVLVGFMALDPLDVSW